MPRYDTPVSVPQIATVGVGELKYIPYTFQSTLRILHTPSTLTATLNKTTYGVPE
jgi:hypothetical protein